MPLRYTIPEQPDLDALRARAKLNKHYVATYNEINPKIDIYVNGVYVANTKYDNSLSYTLYRFMLKCIFSMCYSVKAGDSISLHFANKEGKV